MAESERNGSHNISEATTSLMSPTSASRSHNVILFDATTADRLLQLEAQREGESSILSHTGVPSMFDLAHQGWIYD
jgi:hypothetical protein